MSFSIDLSSTTELLERFHRTLMDRRGGLDWEGFDASRYPAHLIERARIEWAGRAVAEYLSTAQFGQLLHRLTRVGAPIELIGAATRLALDECRHAELCAKMADVLGGRQGFDVPDPPLSLYESEQDPWVAIYRTVLSVCCFGETLSVPMLQAIAAVATDPLAEAAAEIIAADEAYHANFGWQTLTWLTPRLTPEQRSFIASRLPILMGHFESGSRGGPEMLEGLAGQEVTIEAGDDNLGTLTDLQYAVIFYDTMESTIIPGLTELGFDAITAWQNRIISTDRHPPERLRNT